MNKKSRLTQDYYSYQSCNRIIRYTTTPTYITQEDAIKKAINLGYATLELVLPDGKKRDLTHILLNRLSTSKAA